MAVRRSWVGLSLVAGLAGAELAAADSLTDYYGPREIALGESGRGMAMGSSAISLNPAGLAMDRGFVFDGSWGHRSVDGATLVSLSACDSTVPVPGCFYYHYFDVEEGGVARRVHEGGALLSRSLSSQLFLGVNTRYFDYNSNVAGDADDRGFATDVGLAFRPAPVVSVGVTGYNLLAPDIAQYPLGLGAGLSVRPLEVLGISFDALWNLEREAGDSKARYGGAAELFLRSPDGQSGYPLRVGGVYDSFAKDGYVSGGLGFSNLKVGLEVSLRKQVKGGDDLTFIGGLRLFGPTAQP